MGLTKIRAFFESTFIYKTEHGKEEKAYIIRSSWLIAASKVWKNKFLVWETYNL